MELKRCNSDACNRHKEYASNRSPRLSITRDTDISNNTFPDYTKLRTNGNTVKRRKFASSSTGHLSQRSQFMFQQAIHCDDVMEETKTICRDYICCRLKRSGYRGKVVITGIKTSSDQTSSMILLNAGTVE